MEEEPRILVRTLRRSQTDKLALQTAIVHLCCSVACIIIAIFSLAIIKSETIQRVYGLPLWIGLLLLFTGFSGIQCHFRRTKLYAGIYLIFSFLAMFFDLIAIAWMLSIMKKSEATVISLVCVATFDMGISCLSTALGCNILFTDCKMCKAHSFKVGGNQSMWRKTLISQKHVGKPFSLGLSTHKLKLKHIQRTISVKTMTRHFDKESIETKTKGKRHREFSGGLFSWCWRRSSGAAPAEESMLPCQDGVTQESIRLSNLSSGREARHDRQRPPRAGNEPPSYTDAVGPPPPYSEN